MKAGAEVTGFDREFSQNNYPFATEVLDVANAEQVAEVCQRVLQTRERLDVLVNAAGILRMGATDALSIEEWQQTFAVNVGGAFNLFQQTMAQFRRQQGGAIVTVASDAAHTPRIGMSAYGASKAALKNLALTVGLELAGSGVRCNVVSPGSTDTDMQRTLWVSDDAEQQRIRGFGEQFKLGIPLGKSLVHRKSLTRFYSSPPIWRATSRFRISWWTAAPRWGHDDDLETSFNAG